MRGDARANEIPPATPSFPLSLPFASLDVVFSLRFIERRSNFPFAFPLKIRRLKKINRARLPNDDAICEDLRFEATRNKLSRVYRIRIRRGRIVGFRFETEIRTTRRARVSALART